MSDTDTPVAIRVRAGDRLVEAAGGGERADVAATFPHLASAARSGFGVTLELPAGTWQVAVDACAEDGEWRVLGARTVVVRATPLRASLDTPPAMTAPAGAIRFSGWCVHPKLRIADLRLAVGATSVACQFGSERGDVAAALPGIPGADRSGFEATVEVAPLPTE